MMEPAQDVEEDRLRALESYGLLDTDPEALLDKIAQLTSKILAVPIVLVSLIDTNRQWFKARVGLDVQELSREYAFCDHAIRGTGPMVVGDALSDPRFEKNPLVTGAPGIRFYCGVPLRTPQGHGLGSFCVIDRVPRVIDPASVEILVRLARLVETEFEIRRRLRLLEHSLEAATESQHRKDLLISMVVHDLRSPLTAIGLVAGMLADEHPSSRELIDEMLESIEGMRNMITDLLDISLGESGQLRPRARPVTAVQLIEASVSTCRRLAAYKAQRIVIDATTAPPHFTADPELLTRVLCNLIGNAIQYGPAGQTIAVTALQLPNGGIRFEVADRCPPVPKDAAKAIFRPFERLHAHARPEGRGLGLAFCRLAVEAHHGTIGVTAEPGGNRFFFELPAGCVNPPAANQV